MTCPCRTGPCTATQQRQVPPLPRVGPPGPASGLCWDLWRPRVSGPSRDWKAVEPERQQLGALVLGIMPWWESGCLLGGPEGLQTPPPLEGAYACGRDGLGGRERITRRGAGGAGAGGGPGSGPVSGTHLGLSFLAQTRDGVIHSFRMIINYGREEVPALGFEPFPLLFLFFLLMSVMGSAET